MGFPSSAMSPADDDDHGSIRSDLYSPQALGQLNPSRRCPRVLSVLSSLLQRLVTRNDRAHSSSSPPSSSSSSSPSSPSSFGSSSPYSSSSSSSPSSSPTAVSSSYGYNSSCKASRSLVLRSRGRGDWGVFDGVHPPTIGIEEYLQRIFRYANCSPSCFVVAYAYLDRLIDHSSTTNHQQQQQPALRVTSLNIHRLLITTVLVAAKFLDDMYYDNAYYAQIGGISTQEMNRLEKEFLFLMDFRLHVSVSVFESYCGHLEREVAMGGGYQIEKALIRSICAMDHGTDSTTSSNSNCIYRNRNTNAAVGIIEQARTYNSLLLAAVSAKLSTAA